MTNQGLRDAPPAEERVTDYDRAHLQAYLRLLDAAAAHADWREAAALILGLDVDQDPSRAQAIHDAHLERARWMSRAGYRELFRRGPGG
jgi:hypothetical protein